MISLVNICKEYDGKVIYDNFNLDIEEGKTTVILGESGAGKTTLLNILTGATDFRGKILNLPQKTSVVFQDNLLVPNLTIRQNIELVKPDMDSKAVLELVGLSGTLDDYPKTYSAGMRRRVAIARAISVNAPFMIMDEPFINLDLALKFSLMEKIKILIRERQQTVLMITHDIKEAVTMGDRVVVVANNCVAYDNRTITERTESELFEFMLSMGGTEVKK